MKKNEIYIVAGVILLVFIFGWAGMRKKGSNVAIAPQEVSTTTTPTSDAKTGTKTTAPVSKSPTSVNPAVVEEKPVPTLVTNKTLNGSSFVLATYNGTPVPSGTKITLSFTDTKFTLQICNTLSSNYFVSGNLFEADNVISTQMYCATPANIMKIETDANILLNSRSATIYRSGSSLILSEPKNNIVMAFEGF